MNDNDIIYQEYNSFIENLKIISRFKENQNSNNSNFISLNNDFGSTILHFLNKNLSKRSTLYFLLNKTMEIISKKIPQKYTETSINFMNYFNLIDIYSQGNILIKNKNDINLIFSHFCRMYSMFSLIIENDINNYYQKIGSNNRNKCNIQKYLIKNIFSSLNTLNNSYEIYKLKIFNDDNFSIKLLNYSYTNEITFYIIGKVNSLFCKGNFIILFFELIKNNIRNIKVFEILLSLLSDKEKKVIFNNNNKLIIKYLYKYIMINEYLIVQMLLKNLEKYSLELIIQKLIFPPKDEDEYNRIFNYLKIAKNCKYIINKDEIENENKNDDTVNILSK